MNESGGNSIGTCTFTDNAGGPGTKVTIYTATRKVNLPAIRVDAHHKVIVGEQFTMTIEGDWNSYTAHVDPQQIASAVDGRLVPQTQG